MSTELDPKVTETIDSTAEACAVTLLEQGWDVDGEEYELDNYSGDLDALQTALRHEPSIEERIEFEQSVRDALNADVIA